VSVAESMCSAKPKFVERNRIKRAFVPVRVFESLLDRFSVIASQTFWLCEAFWVRQVVVANCVHSTCALTLAPPGNPPLQENRRAASRYA
jgi:hypothetical protein